MQSIKSGNFKGLKQTISACVALVAVVCACVVLFAKEGILVFATKEYIDAVWFIAPLALSTLFSFIYGIIGNIMFYYEKTWQMSVITMVTAGINIVTNYFGIKWFGSIAAGYTTLICSVLQVFAYYCVVSRYEKNLKQIIDMKLFAIIVVVFVFIMTYSMVFYNNFWFRFCLLSIIVVITLIMRKKIIDVFKSMKRN